MNSGLSFHLFDPYNVTIMDLQEQHPFPNQHKSPDKKQRAGMRTMLGHKTFPL